LKDHDFIGIAERLDESLVVLTMLLGVPLGDVLHLDSKRSGGYYDGGYHGHCYLIFPTNVTPDMQAHLSSSEYQTAIIFSIYHSTVLENNFY
jgi:hypothetical protein